MNHEGSGFGVSLALLSDVQAAATLGVSVRKFHELRHEAFMPAAIVLGPRLLKWSLEEIREAIKSMPRQKSSEEPLHLAKARAAKAGHTEVTV